MAAIYQLFGHPGTGKYTIAKEIVRQLVERGEPAALLDNHATANLVWSLVPASRRFEPEVMARMQRIRGEVLDAVEELAAPELSLVFTSFLPPSVKPTIVNRHRSLAIDHGRAFVAVVLELDPEEVLRRIPNPDRAERLKLVNVDTARRQMANGMTVPDWPELVHFDITGLSAEESARQIIEGVLH